MIRTVLSSLARIFARHIASRFDACAAGIEHDFGWPDEYEPGTTGAKALRCAELLRCVARDMRRAA